MSHLPPWLVPRFRAVGGTSLPASLPASIAGSLSAAALSVTQGLTVTTTVTLVRTNFSGDVTLSVTGLPSGVSGSFSNATLSGGTLTSVLTLTATGVAPVVADDGFVITLSGAGVTSVTLAATVSVVVATLPAPLVFDDFSSYANTAALLANVGTIGAGKKYAQIDSSAGCLTLDTGVRGPEGNPTVRLRIFDGSTSTPRLIANGTARTHIWVRWVCKWSPGFCNLIGNGYTGAKAHKQPSFNFNGVNGRILGSITAGTGTPGGTSNDGEYQFEVDHNTSVATLFHSPTLRRVIDAATGTSMYQDGKWYEHILHYERVSTYHTRTRIWLQEFGTARLLLCTINCRDRAVNGHNGIDQLTFWSTFNALSSGTPVGVDQSVYLSRWDQWDNSLTADPFGLGTTADATRDLSLSTPNASVSIARGSSDTRVITAARGSAFATNYVHMLPVYQPPSGLTVSCSPTLMTAPGDTTTVTFAASLGMATGTYIVHVQGITSASLTKNDVGMGGVGSASNFVTFTVDVT